MNKKIAVMPAYNAALTIEKTVNDIPANCIDEIIVVDDKSSDNTVDIAKSLGLTVIEHKYNKGYGGNQKTCYQEALKKQADIIIMIHPDYQYDSSLTDEIIRPIESKSKDIMLGNRITSFKNSRNGGMPIYKYLSNRFLTMTENFVLNQNLSEYHTGFRAYDSSLLKSLPFENYSNDFVFDSQLLFGAIALGANIGEINVPVRYFNEASSINFFNSIKYGTSIIKDLLLYKVSNGKYFI